MSTVGQPNDRRWDACSTGSRPATRSTTRLVIRRSRSDRSRRQRDVNSAEPTGGRRQRSDHPQGQRDRRKTGTKGHGGFHEANVPVTPIDINSVDLREIAKCGAMGGRGIVLVPAGRGGVFRARSHLLSHRCRTSPPSEDRSRPRTALRCTGRFVPSHTSDTIFGSVVVGRTRRAERRAGRCRRGEQAGVDRSVRREAQAGAFTTERVRDRGDDADLSSSVAVSPSVHDFAEVVGLDRVERPLVADRRPGSRRQRPPRPDPIRWRSRRP